MKKITFVLLITLNRWDKSSI